MALAFLYTCACGKRFKVYIPRLKLFAAMTGTTVNWRAEDERDQADGSIAELERLAGVNDCLFVDGRVCEEMACPACRQELCFLSHFRAIMAGSEGPRSVSGDSAGRPSTPAGSGWRRLLGLHAAPGRHW
jgi:hypothetical protein